MRHLYATMVRRVYGLEAAQVLLGHAHAAITETYAERDATLATKEHYLVDIVAGVALALVVDALVWRRTVVATAPAPVPLPAES